MGTASSTLAGHLALGGGGGKASGIRLRIAAVQRRLHCTFWRAFRVGLAVTG